MINRDLRNNHNMETLR